jgi:steroid Delta-isomerase
MDSSTHRAALTQLTHYFESISEATVPDLARFYTADAFFKDPFNEVRGIDKIIHIFAQMYGPLMDPKFVVKETLLEGERAFLVWDFTFRIRRYKPDVTQRIEGTSHLAFAADGRVAYHRDYWDAANELYAKLPMVGGLMRFLAKKMG